MISIFQRLREIVWLQKPEQLPQGKLLERFVHQGDEAAFAALMRLHGPMVLNVCNRVLRNHHDAEEAFQATFLVLALKAGSIVSPNQLGSWLYGVAYRTALKTKGLRDRRRLRETFELNAPEPESPVREPWDDISPVLDQEISSLPEKYRTAIVLCDLEGRSCKDVADELGCPEGTLSSRLTRGRSLLAKRLTKQGISLSAGPLLIILSHNVASATVPESLFISSLHASQASVVQQSVASGFVSPGVAQITNGVMKSMLYTSLKQATLGLILIGGLGLGTNQFLQTLLAAPGQKELTAESGPEIKSCRLKMTSSLQNGDQKSETFVYWQAPDGLRQDSYESGKPVYETINPPGKSGVDLDHRNKGYAKHLRPNLQKNKPFFFTLMDLLAKHVDHPEQVLAPKSMANVTAPGFELTNPISDADFPDHIVRIWYAPDTKFLLYAELEMRLPDKTLITLFEDFAWNTSTDHWFDISIPVDYQDRTTKNIRNSYTTPELTEDAIVIDVVKAFRTYAKYFEGKFPQVNVIYPDTTRDQIFKRAGLSTDWNKNVGNEAANEGAAAQSALSTIYRIQMNNADWAYFGKQVTLADKDKILFRWKRDDGQYSVIFGDLHSGKANANSWQKNGPIETLQPDEKLQKLSASQDREATQNQKDLDDVQAENQATVPRQISRFFIVANIVLLGAAALYFLAKRVRWK